MNSVTNIKWSPNKNHQKTKNPVSGQTFIEYSIVLGLIAVVVIAMRPMIQRPIQYFIKLTADQIGVQADSDQRFDDTGHLVESEDIVRVTRDIERNEKVNGIIETIIGETTDSDRYVFINLGITEDPR